MPKIKILSGKMVFVSARKLPAAGPFGQSNEPVGSVTERDSILAQKSKY